MSRGGGADLDEVVSEDPVSAPDSSSVEASCRCAGWAQPAVGAIAEHNRGSPSTAASVVFTPVRRYDDHVGNNTSGR